MSIESKLENLCIILKNSQEFSKYIDKFWIENNVDAQISKYVFTQDKKKSPMPADHV